MPLYIFYGLYETFNLEVMWTNIDFSFGDIEHDMKQQQQKKHKINT